MNRAPVTTRLLRIALAGAMKADPGSAIAEMRLALSDAADDLAGADADAEAFEAARAALRDLADSLEPSGAATFTREIV